jgi:hypothetical protein
MSDGKQVKLVIIRSPQPADGSSLIWARAKALVVNDGQSTIPASPQSITFQIADGEAGHSDAFFDKTNNKKTSAYTSATTGWTDYVRFYSKQAGNGDLNATWTTASDGKAFAFVSVTPAPSPQQQCKDVKLKLIDLDKAPADGHHEISLQVSTYSDEGITPLAGVTLKIGDSNEKVPPGLTISPRVVTTGQNGTATCTVQSDAVGTWSLFAYCSLQVRSNSQLVQFFTPKKYTLKIGEYPSLLDEGQEGGVSGTLTDDNGRGVGVVTCGVSGSYLDVPNSVTTDESGDFNFTVTGGDIGMAEQELGWVEVYFSPDNGYADDKNYIIVMRDDGGIG